MKGKRIEPGCLALVIRARASRTAVGRIVRVLYAERPAGSHVPVEVLRDKGAAPIYSGSVDKPSWVVATPDPSRPLPFWTIWPNGSVATKYEVQERGFLEECLMRIDDDEQPEQESHHEDTKKPVHEPTA